MFGECHAHLFMNGLNYQDAVALHKDGIHEETVRRYLSEYQKRGICFIRDGGDNFGVSAYAQTIAEEYGIDYRTPVYAIHRKGRYGSIVGKGFDTIGEYRELVREARIQGADFIKIMLSGLVDFAKVGIITSSPLAREEIREMISIAHEEGMAVMAHANGSEVVIAAAQAGVDSVEHGRYLNEEALWAMAEHHTIWVPTAVTVRNLMGCGRFPEEAVAEIYRCDRENLRLGKKVGVQMALGSDAGAYQVLHGSGIEEEYQTFQEIFGASEELDAYLAAGETKIREIFQRK